MPSAKLYFINLLCALQNFNLNQPLLLYELTSLSNWTSLVLTVKSDVVKHEQVYYANTAGTSICIILPNGFCL